jgi:cyanophycinase
MPPDRNRAGAAGTLALVGSGEFLPTMNDVDRELLGRAGGSRVAILPTASAPDGPGVPERWAEDGVAHFRALGAVPTAVLALDRDGCHLPENVERVRQSNFVYFSGGKPDYLHRTLLDTPLWQAVLGVLARGGILAGCSAGAMIQGGWIPGGFTFGRGFWHPAFALLPGAFVLPHFDEMPGWMLAPAAAFRPRGSFIVGIDGGTALVGSGGRWEVLGRGRVVVQGEPPSDFLGPGVHRAGSAGPAAQDPGGG